MAHSHRSNIPSWPTFLETIRKAYNWNISEFADYCHVSRSTIAVTLGTTRSVERPRAGIALKIAAGLGIPQLAMAVIAGYMDLDALDKTIDVLNWPLRKLVPLRGEWWNRTGGSYLQCCREQNHLSVQEVVHRWNSQWSIPVSEDDWFRVEQAGIFPTGSDPSPFQGLERLPGTWLWAIVAACATDETVYADLVGLALVLGRISTFGRHRREWVQGSDDYENLLTVFTQALDKTQDAVDVQTFRATLLNLSLHIPTVIDDETTHSATNPPAPAPTPSRVDWHRIGNHIRQLRQAGSLTAEMASDLVGTSLPQWEQWEAGEGPIPLDALNHIAMLFNIPLTALLQGIRSESVPSESAAHSDLLSMRVRDLLTLRDIPILGRIVAGIPLEAQPDPRGSAVISQDLPGDFALEVHGDSMVGAGIHEGDLVIAKRVESWESVPPHRMVVALVDGESTLKFLVRETDPLDGDRWVLRAANPTYPDRPMNPRTDRVQGIVTAVQTAHPPMWPSALSLPASDPADLLAGLTPEQQAVVLQMIEQLRHVNPPPKPPRR